MTKDEIKLVMKWCLPLDTNSQKIEELADIFENEHKEAINYTRSCRGEAEQLKTFNCINLVDGFEPCKEQCLYCRDVKGF